MHKISGKIIVALSKNIGVTKDGKDWEKRDYVLETSDIYRTKLRFSMMSFDGPIVNPPAVGDKVNLGFSVEAKEYNGKWYNDVKALQIEKLDV